MKVTITAQKMKFFSKDFFSKRDQIRIYWRNPWWTLFFVQWTSSGTMISMNHNDNYLLLFGKVLKFQKFLPLLRASSKRRTLEFYWLCITEMRQKIKWRNLGRKMQASFAINLLFIPYEFFFPVHTRRRPDLL